MSAPRILPELHLTFASLNAAANPPASPAESHAQTNYSDGIKHAERNDVPAVGESLTELGNIKIRHQPELRQISIDIPVAEVEQVYYRRDGDKLVISEDLRFFGGTSNFDNRGLYSLLQFGAQTPPHTVWRGVKRFTPGRRSIVDLQSLEIREEELPGAWNAQPFSESDATELEPRLADALDLSLIKCCPGKNPVVMFSGGVDSSLIAARCKHLGWDDTTLAHFTFGDEDPETEIARRMAQSLDLELVIIRHSSASADTVGEIVGDFKRPFGDHSTISARCIAKACSERFPGRAVFDGTGADGGFGMLAKIVQWERFTALPSPLRRSGGWLYRNLNVWRSDNRLQRVLKIFARSASMPMLCALVAQNALSNCLYFFRDDVVDEVHQNMLQWLERVIPDPDALARASSLDLAFICAGIFAQKNKSILGSQVFYPFLDNDVLCVARQTWSRANITAEPKMHLKSLLAASVPHELVYRPKSGFISPHVSRDFARPKFIETFVSSKNLLLELGVLDPKGINLLQDRLQSGGKLGPQVYNFVWVLTFGGQWLAKFSAQSAPSNTVLAAN